MFSRGSAGKESTCNARDLSLIPRLERSPGEGKGYPLQYFGVENSMDCIVHGVTESQTQRNDFYFTLVAQWQRIHLSKQEMWVRSWGWEMATHFSILAWEISWTEEPDRLQSMESQKSGKSQYLFLKYLNKHGYSNCGSCSVVSESL